MLKRSILLLIVLALLLGCTAALADVCPSHNLVVRRERPSTCIRQGEIIYECTNPGCDYEKFVPLPVRDHLWERVSKKESTCTTHGHKDYVCKFCHATKRTELELADHAYGSWSVVRESTCSEKGLKVRYCRNCGAKQSRNTALLPHTYTDWSLVREATDRSMGMEERSCCVCGVIETRGFYPKGTLHADLEDNAAVRTLQQYLIGMGLLKSRVDGNYGKKTQQAVMAYQQMMGFEPTGIAYPQTLKALFCFTEENGSISMTNTPHVYGDWTVITEATGSAQGLRKHACLFCGYEVEAVYDPIGTLRPGMPKCEEVKELQKLLIEKKIIKTVADGDYGDRTELGVRTFQRMAGLEETGIAYPETIEALKNWVVEE